MKKLLGEIHGRSLWQVLGIYAVGAWVALQVVDVLAQNFGLPEWFPAFALALLVIGLPIVVATAVVQVGSRVSEPSVGEGDPASPAAAVQRSSGGTLFTWRNAILGGVGAFALWGVVAAGWMLLGPGAATGTSESGSGTAESRGVRDLRSVGMHHVEELCLA